MRIIAIGDLHGKDCWLTIDPDKYDKIIFVGDYVDASDISREKIVENLEQVIAFKLKHPEKVELLLGNHDIQ
jgi:predicted MPP superfamily phosphohydrolase